MALAIMILLVIGPGFFNDLLYIDNLNYQSWLTFDYGFRIVQMLIIVSYRPFRDVIFSVLRGGRLTIKGIVGAAFCVALALFGSFLSNLFFYEMFGGESAVLFKFPQIEHEGIRLIDLTFGLALVAISEELIYRGLLAAWLRRYFSSTLALLIIPAIIFASIHWSHGPSSVISAFFIGIILMVLYLRTKSLLPSILAHYAINFAYFY